jgi:hypothetical protein
MFATHLGGGQTPYTNYFDHGLIPLLLVRLAVRTIYQYQAIEEFNNT